MTIESKVWPKDGHLAIKRREMKTKRGGRENLVWGDERVLKRRRGETLTIEVKWAHQKTVKLIALKRARR